MTGAAQESNPQSLYKTDVMPVQPLDSSTNVVNVQDGEMIALSDFTESFFDIAPPTATTQKNQKTKDSVMFLVTARILHRSDERVALKTQN